MPDQTTQWVDWPQGGYSPVGGVNTVDAEDSLGDTEVAMASNLLFERGMCFNRPGLEFTQSTNISHQVVFAKGLISPQQNLVIDTSGLIWKVDPSTIAGTQITGAATGFGARQFHNADIVNNVALIGNNSAGIIQWDYTGNTYVVLSPGARYRYVSGQLARAVAAYGLTGGINDPITFAWSKAGDQTIWTGATNGSGTIVLSDAPDAITGCKVLRNVVVLFRTTGKHLAYYTGQLLPVFRVETAGRDSNGCPFPATLATDGDVAFYVGSDNVYSYDLTQDTPIGDKILNQLFPILEAGTLVVGFTTRYVKGSNRQLVPCLRYHLVSIGSGASVHFCYNTLARSWSIHNYATTFAAASNFIGVGGSVVRDLGFAGWDASVPAFRQLWNNGANLDQPASFTSRLFHIGDARQMDFVLQRILLGSRDYGNGYNVTITATCRLANAVVNFTQTLAPGSNNDGYLIRNWFDMMQDNQAAGTGQDFQLTLSVPSGAKFAMNYLQMRLHEAGEFHG